MPCRMRHFHETNTTLQAVGFSPHPFTTYWIPEKDGNSKAFRNLWSRVLTYLRFMHQGFASCWANTLKSTAFCCFFDMATGNYP